MVSIIKTKAYLFSVGEIPFFIKNTNMHFHRDYIRNNNLFYRLHKDKKIF